MAQHLTSQLGKPVSAAWVRKVLQRAHEKSAELLVDEVKYSLGTATDTELHDELRKLDLLKYCRSVLRTRLQGVGDGLVWFDTRRERSRNTRITHGLPASQR